MVESAAGAAWEAMGEEDEDGGGGDLTSLEPARPFRTLARPPAARESGVWAAFPDGKVMGSSSGLLGCWPKKSWILAYGTGLAQDGCTRSSYNVKDIASA